MRSCEEVKNVNQKCDTNVFFILLVLSDLVDARVAMVIYGTRWRLGSSIPLRVVAKL